jgi:hypothetical protein
MCAIHATSFFFNIYMQLRISTTSTLYVSVSIDFSINDLMQWIIYWHSSMQFFIVFLSISRQQLEFIIRQSVFYIYVLVILVQWLITAAIYL